MSDPQPTPSHYSAVFCDGCKYYYTVCHYGSVTDWSLGRSSPGDLIEAWNWDDHGRETHWTVCAGGMRSGSPVQWPTEASGALKFLGRVFGAKTFRDRASYTAALNKHLAAVAAEIAEVERRLAAVCQGGAAEDVAELHMHAGS